MTVNKVRLKVKGSVGKSVNLRNDNTIGAVIGSTLMLPDGSVPTLAQLASALHDANTNQPGNITVNTGTTITQWPTIGGVPAAITNPRPMLQAEDPDDPIVIPGPPGKNGIIGVNGQPGPAVFLEAEPPDDPILVPGPRGPQGVPGSGSITLTDGTTTVASVSQITVSGGTVGGTSPNATLAVTGGGGVSVYGILTTVPQTGWTLDNNAGVVTAAYDATGALLLNVASTISNQSFYRRTCPGGNFDVQMLASVEGQTSVSLGVRDSSTGNIEAYGGFGSGTQGAALCLNLTSTAGTTFTGWSYSSNPAGPSSGTGNTPYPQPATWFRLTRVGTTYTLYYSLSGAYWNPLFSITNTFAATPDQIGIFIGNNPAGLIRVLSWAGA